MGSFLFPVVYHLSSFLWCIINHRSVLLRRFDIPKSFSCKTYYYYVIVSLASSVGVSGKNGKNKKIEGYLTIPFPRILLGAHPKKGVQLVGGMALNSYYTTEHSAFFLLLPLHCPCYYHYVDYDAIRRNHVYYMKNAVVSPISSPDLYPGVFG